LAGTATEAGTDRADASLLKLMEAPAGGAAFESVTVQEALALAARLDAAHCIDETRAGETRTIEVVAEDPFRAASIVTVWSEAIDVAMMLNEAEVAFAGMVTDAGIERAEATLLKVTEAPAGGAAFERVTVQEVFAFAERLGAAH